jgi:hypothetical protein
MPPAESQRAASAHPESRQRVERFIDQSAMILAGLLGSLSSGTRRDLCPYCSCKGAPTMAGVQAICIGRTNV